MSPIKHFTHNKHSGDLWQLVGAWCVDLAVHKALGNPITSKPGDLWAVYVNKNAEPQGFIQARIANQKTLHVRYLWTKADSSEIVQSTLIQDMLTIARNSGITLVYTNDRQTTTIWTKHGFTQTTTPKRGEFCRWEKSL